MDSFAKLLAALTPPAQVMLFVCLLVSIVGIIGLLFVTAFSRNATKNICQFLTSIVRVVGYYHNNGSQKSAKRRTKQIYQVKIPTLLQDEE